MSEVLWRRLGYMLSPQLDIYRRIADRVTGEDVIDLGFGTGFGTLQLCKHAKSVTGIEVDGEAVEFASANLPGVRWAVGDISRDIRYIGKDYDTALMIEVLEHIDNWRKALEHVCDVLKPTGRLIISARNANADLRKNELHYREWMASEFKQALMIYFGKVTLYDYTLTTMLDDDTRQTPLIAIAHLKGDKHDNEQNPERR